MKRRSPQEKKRLSYEKDRRNAYGANDKASRRLVPQEKRKVVRAYRRLTNQQLPSGPHSDVGDIDATEDRIASTRRKQWRKLPDRPLKDHVEKQTVRRRWLRGRRLDPGSGSQGTQLKD